MVIKVILCVFLCVLVTQTHSQTQNKEVVEARLVNTAQGPVRGYREDDLFVFYGVPYATAPTGVHKFKAPLEPPNWEEPFETVNRGIMCPQKVAGIDLNIGQEDCLVASIFVPDTNGTNLPVVVFFHGGAFLLGFGDQLTPRNLVRSKRIVAVTFNYRLGIHGFLCLGTENAPGNAGLKDQVALLRWVNKNIAAFGGNPNDVTIAGYSAGATSVELIMLSKTAIGLFNKVILDSAASIAAGAIQLDPLQTAREYARKMGLTNAYDANALEQFYINAPFDVILNTDHFFTFPNSTFGFVPCVERDIGEVRFLEEDPVSIIEKGSYDKVPMLYGFTKMEGLFRILNFEDELFYEWKDQMNEKFSDFLPADLEFESENQREEISKIIKEFYFGNRAVSEETVYEYIEYFTDVLFAYPILRSVKLHVEGGHDKIYLYEYIFVADENPSLLTNIKVRGADHCDQTYALLDGLGANLIGVDESNLSERTQKMKTKIRELWLNFITIGTPVPMGSLLLTWPPVGVQRAPHMSLNETSRLLGALNHQRAQFWDDIYERHYRTPVAPSSASNLINSCTVLCIIVWNTILVNYK